MEEYVVNVQSSIINTEMLVQCLGLLFALFIVLGVYEFACKLNELGEDE